jgi:hypothetical protein
MQKINMNEKCNTRDETRGKKGMKLQLNKMKSKKLGGS